MPRRPRIGPAGVCFHVLNRSVARLPWFEKPADYEAFERVLGEALEREPLPIEQDDHLAGVLRYVERNAPRASLCEATEAWKYGSAWRSVPGDEPSREILAEWPIPRLRPSRSYVNKPQSVAELEPIRHSVTRGTPFCSPTWVTQSAARLQLRHTLRSRGRPPRNQ
ncbi:MAG TPA: hypothetical protein VIY86_10605 [Pirellulaceae bacterium]